MDFTESLSPHEAKLKKISGTLVDIWAKRDLHFEFHSVGLKAQLRNFLLKRDFLRRLLGSRAPGESVLPSYVDALLRKPWPVHVPEDPFQAIPTEFVARPKLRIACVADELSFRSWQYEADFVALPRQSWRETLESGPFDLLLVESAWEGPGGGWGKDLADLSRKGRRSDELLDQVVSGFQGRGVPTVFYAKEDPVDRDLFLGAAERFDFVFTTDEDSISFYEKKLGHKRVACLPFAAQPRLHHPPADSEPRPGSVFFAGTWYAKRHPERRRQAENLLRPALEHGLAIFDRVEALSNSHYRWPAEYESALVGAIPYARMGEASGLYRVGLNINSVTTSPTMLSRRVFELLASGTPVISSPSPAISRFFGSDLVRVSSSPEETQFYLEGLLSEDAAWQELSLKGAQCVLEKHTYRHRLDSLLGLLGRGSGE